MKTIVACIVALAFVAVALSFPVTPVSDFAQYWQASGDFSQYIKGGVLVLLYAPFARAGFPPFLAALLVNLAAFLLLARVFPKSSLAAFALLLIGVSWSAWSPVVNSDLPSAALLAAGVVWITQGRRRSGLVALSLGLSIRMQSLAVALFVLVVLVLLSPRLSIPRAALAVLALAVACGWLIDAALKLPSVQRVEIENSRAVPLIAGMLTPCGSVTTVSNAMVAEYRGSIMQIPVAFLKTSSPGSALRLAACKWGKVAGYGSSGAFWLAFPGPEPAAIAQIESAAVYGLKLLLFVLLSVRLYNSRLHDIPSLVSLLVLSGFVLLYTVFEIQPRYLIPALVIPLALLATPAQSLIQSLPPKWLTRYCPPRWLALRP